MILFIILLCLPCFLPLERTFCVYSSRSILTAPALLRDLDRSWISPAHQHGRAVVKAELACIALLHFVLPSPVSPSLRRGIVRGTSNRLKGQLSRLFTAFCGIDAPCDDFVCTPYGSGSPSHHTRCECDYAQCSASMSRHRNPSAALCLRYPVSSERQQRRAYHRRSYAVSGVSFRLYVLLYGTR